MTSSERSPSHVASGSDLGLGECGIGAWDPWPAVGPPQTYPAGRVPQPGPGRRAGSAAEQGAPGRAVGWLVWSAQQRDWPDAAGTGSGNCDPSPKVPALWVTGRRGVPIHGSPVSSLWEGLPSPWGA
ncbi:hypothetical protein VULLAG_LOCUS22093 [Vulpes lagopus]